MIYSKTCEYGLRALAFLATKSKTEWTRIPEIAEHTGVPGPYIAKIFQGLVMSKILKSSRGPHGGFSFSQDPKMVSVMKIMKAIDAFEPWQQCVMGLDTCHDRNACPVHPIWKEAKKRILLTFEHVSLKDMTKNMISPRFRKLRRARLNLHGSHSGGK